jgi:hypothetical protein
MENNILMICEDLKIAVNQFLSESEISTNHPIIQDMFSFIKSMEMNIDVIQFKSKDKSKFATEKNGEYIKTPILLLYTKYTNDLTKNKVHFANANWDESYQNTRLIVDKWNLLLSFYGFPEEYQSDDTKVLIYSFEIVYENLMYRKLKAQILEICEKICDEYAPKFIFVDSTPNYTILFRNEDDMMKFISLRKVDFEDYVLKLFAEVNIFSYYKIEKINITYNHLESSNLNIYGLSRED